MKSPPTDPRALRTRQSLREALMSAVVKKPFRELTIHDITQHAGINRATFYLHYEDKYDLLQDCATDLLGKIRGAIEKKFGLDEAILAGEAQFLDHNNRMYIVLQHIQKNSDFYKAMFVKDGDPIFYNMFRDTASAWIRDQVKTVLQSQNRPVDEELIEMMVRFQSAGNFDVISWWLEHDMVIPIETMAKRLAMITLPPLIRMIKGDITDL